METTVRWEEFCDEVYVTVDETELKLHLFQKKSEKEEKKEKGKEKITKSSLTKLSRDYVHQSYLEYP